MTYSKINFVDRQVSRPKTYTMTTNSDNSVTLTDSFGTITTLGTPLNAENMNHIESGIANAATVDLDNLSTAGQAVLNQRATTSLDNLSSVGQAKFDAKQDSLSTTQVASTNAPYLKAAYVNGTSGYNIWSNGYCEQWGVTTFSSGGTTVTLTKTMANTNYMVLTSFNATGSGGFGEGVNIYNKTSTGFSGNGYHSSGTQDQSNYWRVFGYLASGQY